MRFRHRKHTHTSPLIYFQVFRSSSRRFHEIVVDSCCSFKVASRRRVKGFGVVLAVTGSRLPRLKALAEGDHKVDELLHAFLEQISLQFFIIDTYEMYGYEPCSTNII